MLKNHGKLKIDSFEEKSCLLNELESYLSKIQKKKISQIGSLDLEKKETWTPENSIFSKNVFIKYFLFLHKILILR